MRGNERRDYRTRGELLARVVAWLGQQTEPVQQLPDALAPPGVGERILKLLGLRGLLKYGRSGWSVRPFMKKSDVVDIAE